VSSVSAPNNIGARPRPASAQGGQCPAPSAGRRSGDQCPERMTNRKNWDNAQFLAES